MVQCMRLVFGPKQAGLFLTVCWLARNRIDVDLLLARAKRLQEGQQ